MKRLLLSGIIIFALIAAIGAIAMTGNFNENKTAYNNYSPSDSLIDVAFQYPQGWNIFERRGSYSSFIQVQIVEPAAAGDATKMIASSIDVTIYPQSKAEFSPATAAGMAEDIKKKRLSLKGSQLISQTETKIAGVSAIEETFSYAIFQMPLQKNAVPIPVIERIICFKKGDNYYTISFNQDRERFAHYEKIFKRIAGSLRFLK